MKPHPGWDYQVVRSSLPEPVEVEGTTITEVISKVTWTSRSAEDAIGPGQYDEFSVSVGFLPEDEQMFIGLAVLAMLLGGAGEALGGLAFRRTR